MKHSRMMNAIILALLLLSSTPVRGQDTAGSQQYLPFIVSGQSSTSAHDYTPPEQRAQTTGVTFTVSKFTDSADGVCDADCSLREAISAANQHPGADIVPLVAGVYQLTIAPALDNYGSPREDEDNAIGDLALTDELTLLGAGAEMTTIESTMHQRVFKVLANAKAQFSQFTITGGATAGHEDGGGLFNAGELTMNHVRMVDIQIGNSDAASGNGGSIYNIGTLALFDSTIANNTAYADGGGIFNTGVMTMTNVQVTGNQAGGYDGGGRGGGIYNTGALTIYNSQIMQNGADPFGTAAGAGGGINNEGVLKVYASLIQDNTTSGGESQTQGGGVSNRGEALISDSTVTANTAELGGGLAIFGGNVTVLNSSINGNQGSIGGGLWNSGGATLTLRNSTISQNIVSGDGGGIYSDGAVTFVTLQNSTVSANQSTNGGSGGGLWNSGGSTMTLLNTTVSGNRSSYNGGGINNTRNAGLFTMRNSTIADNHAQGNGGGLWNDENSRLTYHNTIIAGNTAAQSGPDCQNEAILTSQAHNLVGNSTGCDSSAPGDLTVAPNALFLHVIQPLKSNEPGQTATHALLPSSPAIDGGDDTVCPTTDQRGVPRPQGAHCDIGAYEGVLSGLVSWWQAEGDATDVLGANDGSLQNQAGFVPGFAGQAFALDGVDDWVIVPDSPTLNLGDRDFTAALWVNFASTDEEQVLLEKFVETLRDQDRARIGWSITKLADQSLRVVGPLLTDDGAILNTGVLPITADRWHYVVLTRERSNFILYWDGQIVGGASTYLDLDSKATLKIGHRGNPTDTPGSLDDRGFYLHGCVDEVQLWDHALSDEEIAATAAMGRNEACIATPTTPGYLFVSSNSSGKAGNVKFRDEDIVAYDFATNTWQMVFDGSDVGVTKDVDAFAFRPDGTLLLSFNSPTVVSGLGTVDDSDIVLFTPTQLGSDTAGSFVWFLHGADVGLTTDGEDIDAIGITAAGKIVVSTIGDFNTPTLAGKDEDLMQLDDPSSSAWSLFLDGSAVGLANEDVNGFWLDIATGERYLTVKDSFAFSDGPATVQIDSDDIFVCTPTQADCAYRRFWDSDSHDYGAENLDSLGLGVLPARLVVGGQGRDGAASTPEETATDDDIDDINLEELTNRLFLPLVQQ